MKENGRIIPGTVDLVIAPVEAPDIYKQTDLTVTEKLGLDFASMQSKARNNLLSEGGYRDDRFLADAQKAYQIDSYKTAAGDHINATRTFPVREQGTLHGFCGWFSSLLAEGVPLTNYPPGLPSWNNSIFSLQEPVSVEPGDLITLRLKANHPQGYEPIWQWDTRVERQEESIRMPKS